ncbi:Uncharacterised protein [BD1-7 clade bacterium]|uniref:Uncharacterized protein n=1 Tax=BD1-7 clade bacterium TaxID=2029982 RepID=A0A5S9PHQ6_9GAMM|nr:Uncharacterised protein [BD1-7 clade bacterium]CAA0103584.1 Uncharacterised protein [BD1-7 clade bacterium]
MITLKNTLRINATSCIGFGLLFMLFSSTTNQFLSATEPAPAIIIQVLGAILLVNGLHLLWASKLKTPSAILVMYFSVGDFLWVFLSAVLALLGIWIDTPAGIAATLIIALMVGTLGTLQLANLPKQPIASSRLHR